MYLLTGTIRPKWLSSWDFGYSFVVERVKNISSSPLTIHGTNIEVVHAGEIGSLHEPRALLTGDRTNKCFVHAVFLDVALCSAILRWRSNWTFHHLK